MPAGAGDAADGAHRGAGHRVGVGVGREIDAAGQRTATAEADEARALTPADADPVRGDDHDRRRKVAGELERGRHHLGVAPRRPQHSRAVDQVVTADERDLDRVAVALGRLQKPEQLELELLRRRVDERRVQQVRLEVVARRVAVRIRAARRREGGEQRNEKC
jgi:hypothetical protein